MYWLTRCLRLFFAYRVILDINIDERLPHLSNVVNFVVDLGDFAIESACYGDRGFVALHLADILKLFYYVAFFDKPEIIFFLKKGTVIEFRCKYKIKQISDLGIERSMYINRHCLIKQWSLSTQLFFQIIS